ncbi:MAG: Ig-like domain-containing protein [Microbacterium sp.]|uniref:Ig-like domain-containing protein n=1 Tax=Microbacterium TaxID=33882 RepID=UPI00175320C6|nr:hypothetical protein [Acidobacteriota bacterium]
MSTDAGRRRDSAAPSRRQRAARRRLRGFVLGFVGVAAAIGLVGALGAAATVLMGPRVTAVQVDPSAAIAASGSRLIVTTSQSLADVDPTSVTVTPATPFDIDTSGRSIGVRFTVPLDADTEYTVTIDGVTGVSGGPSSTITETFTTPPSEVFLLQRGTVDGDTIFRTDLTGEAAVAVFAHPHIEDYRATRDHLVVLVDEDGESALIMTDLDGQNPVELTLPGSGYIADLQIADRGDRIGYLFTSSTVGTGSGDESALYTASLDTPTAEPAKVVVAGADERVAQWSFVPDTDSVLLVAFDGNLLLTDPEGEAPTALGTALAIDGIAPGTAQAIVERIDGLVVLDLLTGEETPLDVGTDPAVIGSVMPLPRGGTLRTTFPIADSGLPTGATSVVLVDDTGASREVFSAPDTDAVLQTCVSPSGQYAAMLVAPDLASNPYDTYQLPLPATVETHIVELPRDETSEARELVALAGSSISWCRQSVSWR